MNNDLYTKTVLLAKATTLTPKEICTQLRVTERWFYKFMSGEIKNPGVHNVQSLHDLLLANSPDDDGEKRHVSDRRESRRKKVIK